ncbi:putative Protein kinase domain containing protein [Blattamonas nauphoetae]|uniref:Protein kinase domain-containing protein n=1 Tax=Blattamonas nauphoetae TaxID=2049346 RepID=A0ABQ9WLC7_9EUKA|nr:putative Protein kinase domain containing protein [Blattamonas nauphoetae]
MADKIKVPDGYSCVRIISSGGFGTVVELIENATTTHYAGKMVQCLTDKDIERFDREVGRMRRFNHARIIKLKEVVTMDNTKVMVMELGGKSLAEIMKDLTERKVLMAREDVYRVMEDIASALELMHSHADGKTAHGDVKMENILIDADGHAKLCYCGIGICEQLSFGDDADVRVAGADGVGDRTSDVFGGCVVAGSGSVLAAVRRAAVQIAESSAADSRDHVIQIEEPRSIDSPDHITPNRKYPKFVWRRRTSAADANDGPCVTFSPNSSSLLLSSSLMLDQSAESRVTCRQLRLSKSFRCIVNTVEGMWKLKDEEQARRVAAQKEKVKMKEEKRKAEREKKTAEAKLKKVEEANEQAQRDKEKMADEVKKTNEERRVANELKEKCLREMKEMAEKMERMRVMMRTPTNEVKQQLADLPIWVGTESIQTLDRTAHKLAPTCLTQIVDLEDGWRTAFTFPIDEGEWELRIRASENDFVDVLLGFLRHPLPENATQNMCGYYGNGIGGDFILDDGRMWKAGEFKPEGTNKECDEIGQTAAIRVNMRTREARLFVDDSEQPGIFTDIPSPLCLGVTTGFTDENFSVEVLWLKRLRGKNELHGPVFKDIVTLKMLNEELKLHLAYHSIWVGTESLQTLDRTAHKLAPTCLTQIVDLEDGWRTAYTHLIDEGEWELKIRASENTFWAVMLGFLRHPLPENAPQRNCGYWENGIGGHFTLWSGKMWKEGKEFKPEGTNKECDRIGQTAAIRVNMRTREARLFVDDSEQPGIFTDIPSPLCLGITTGFDAENLSVEVLWLKRLRS